MSSSVPLPGDGQPAAVPATSRTQMRQHLETAPPEPTKTALANADLGICHSRAPAIWTHLQALLAMAEPRINRGLGSLATHGCLGKRRLAVHLRFHGAKGAGSRGLRSLPHAVLRLTHR